MIIVLWLIMGLICAAIGHSLASGKGKDPTMWAFICFFFGLIGLIILALSRDERAHTAARGVAYDAPLPPSISKEPATDSNHQSKSAAYGYDRKKWEALLDVDPELGSSAAALRGYGADFEDEFAEKYFALQDRSYIVPLFEKISQRVEEKRWAIQAAELEMVKNLTEDGRQAVLEYKRLVDDGGGLDPDYKSEPIEILPYSGAAPAMKGGVMIQFADGRFLLRGKFIKRLFKTKAEAADWL